MKNDDMITLIIFLLTSIIMIIVVVLSLCPKTEFFGFCGNLIGALISGCIALLVVIFSNKELRKQTMIASQPLVILRLNKNDIVFDFDRIDSSANGKQEDRIILKLINAGNGPAKNITMSIKVNTKSLAKNNRYFKLIGCGMEMKSKESTQYILIEEALNVTRKYLAVKSNEEIEIDIINLWETLKTIIKVCSYDKDLFIEYISKVKLDIKYSYEDLLSNKFEQKNVLYFKIAHFKHNNESVVSSNMKVYLEDVKTP